MSEIRPSWKEIADLMDRWRGKKIVVLGDMILDEFISGTTERVSREAPVIVVRYESRGYSPGGAANAAQNVAALGGRAAPVGISGRDESGWILRECLKSSEVKLSGILSVAGAVTTCKTRVMAGDFHAQRQQVLRIDREWEKELSQGVAGRLISRFERELQGADAAILSDYDHGVLAGPVIQDAVAACRRRKIPVVADSRFRLCRFRGVTTATPNEVEAAQAAGMATGEEDFLAKAGRRLLKRLQASSILVTRGKFGMSLFEPRRRIKSVDVVGSLEAKDVTGAGDTVAAAVALTLAAGGSMADAMTTANLAASIVVMKRGSAVTTVSEMMQRMEELESGIGGIEG